MKRLFLTATLAFMVMLSLQLYSQVAINSDNSLPNGSAMLDVKSTVSGFLPPRMTIAQRNAINNPAAGLLIWQTDSIQGLYYYSGTNWVSVIGSGAGGNSPSLCIDYDGNAYPTFTIGTQTWMAENLRVSHYRNGDAIPEVTDLTEWGSLTTDACCWYNNDQATYGKYGALYNWFTVADPRKLCPQGWHSPTHAEWTVLTTYLGGTTVAGGKMKSTSPLWSSQNNDATNSSGFSGLPGGSRNDNGTFTAIGAYGCWWSSSESSSTNAWCRYLSDSYGYVTVSESGKQSGFSVRCLKD